MSTKEKNSLRGKLTSTNYIKVSYPLLLKYDACAAVFITFMVHMEIYAEEKGLIGNDGFFMLKRDYVRERVGITEKIQTRIKDELVAAGLIWWEKRGIPQKSFIKLNHREINEVLDSYN